MTQVAKAPAEASTTSLNIPQNTAPNTTSEETRSHPLSRSRRQGSTGPTTPQRTGRPLGTRRRIMAGLA